ncbi:MAG: arginyltransferase [Hyphomonadaceae bacterium]|nr:arginyltransferase [Hyphomonadaceae bacterium]MBC6411721.1 arginyltransferase [Hyphomonadaceae bacterium]
MTRPFSIKRLQFYMTMPTPCPYLPGRHERKIFTQLDSLSGPHLNNFLTHSGFRRSQNVLYRPACENCQACQSLRVCASKFEATQSMRRIIRRNQNLNAAVCPAIATQEQFSLMQKYLVNRHPDGGMTQMDYYRYKTMVEECASQTEIMEYRLDDGELVACVLMDRLSDGLSLVYSFFHPDITRQSPGKFMILEHITRCKTEKLNYLYLGYWVPDSPKMAYKALFKPCEVLGPTGWRRLESRQ